MTRTHFSRRIALGALTIGAVAAVGIAGAPSALAAVHQDLPQVSAQQQRAAVSAASTPGARALLTTATRDAATRRHTAMPHTPATIGTHGTPVYALSASFVRGQSETVGQLWYVATSASTGAGPMTLFTAPDKTGAWQAVNVASGNTEARMAAAAHGGSLLLEPQVNAWYAVTADRIKPLNSAAKKVVGPAAVSVASYQHIVQSRYADKQSGSAYAKRGTAGGFSASATTPGGATQGGMSGHGIGLVAGGVLVAGAAGLGLKRRRRA
ncbi:hypothetical protein [Flexivirga alba]|uniref:Gram-positive cocci surface proteins LPxTG domain-containing protein n=1 Tax=Flexivirga alba TaxID=702742 RepID=A0ABW2ADZ8_9MICO